MAGTSFSRPYALRGDGPLGRSAASSSAKRTSRGLPTRGRLGSGGWGWTQERPDHRPHAERRGEKEKVTEHRGEKENLRKWDACGCSPSSPRSPPFFLVPTLCSFLSSQRSAWGRASWPLRGLFVSEKNLPRVANPREVGVGRLGLDAEGLCRAAGGRRLPMLYQPCEEEGDTAWVDGREWAILAVPAMLAHLRDEPACGGERLGA